MPGWQRRERRWGEASFWREGGGHSRVVVVPRVEDGAEAWCVLDKDARDTDSLVGAHPDAVEVDIDRDGELLGRDLSVLALLGAELVLVHALLRLQEKSGMGGEGEL